MRSKSSFIVHSKKKANKGSEWRMDLGRYKSVLGKGSRKRIATKQCNFGKGCRKRIAIRQCSLGKGSSWSFARGQARLPASNVGFSQPDLLADYVITLRILAPTALITGYDPCAKAMIFSSSGLTPDESTSTQ